MNRSRERRVGVLEWWPVAADRLPVGWHLVRPDIPGAPFLEFVPADPRRWHNVVMVGAFVPGVIVLLLAVRGPWSGPFRIAVGVAGAVVVAAPFVVLAVMVRSCAIRGVYTSVMGIMCRDRTLRSAKREVAWEDVRGCEVRVGEAGVPVVVLVLEGDEVALPSYVRKGRKSPEGVAIEASLPRLAEELAATARVLGRRAAIEPPP